MNALGEKAARDLCLALTSAETEEDVVRELSRVGLWDDRTAWHPYGDVPNNRGVVGNQQSSPVAALVEKLVNSIDAVLIAECLGRGIDPRGPSAPQSMAEAVEQFFEVPEGKLQNVNDNSIRRGLAQRIQLIAAGTKEAPAYVVIDDGEGQAPDHFATTFVGLLRDNKTRIPFVQGKFNMGGTGVLQFAGENSFQLIVSRRQPYLRALGEDPRWGFTLVRRFKPGPDEPQSMYVYLAPGGAVPAFAAEALPIRPGPYPERYQTPLEAGTLIKVWNYKLPGRLKTIATLDLRYALERFLPEPALPVRLYERRQGYRANTYETTMSGLATVLADAAADIEPGFAGGSPITVPAVGGIELSLTVVKQEADSKRYPSGVFFVVNGQLHGTLGAEFFKRRNLKLDYVADSLIVLVDCTHLPAEVREDVFLASRDRMRECDERWALEDAVTEYLADHAGLKDLNARRRLASMASAADQDTAAVIESLVRGDPTLAALFGRGEKVKGAPGAIPDPSPFEGHRFPTHFRLANEPAGGLVRRCPKNWTCRIEYETDAENDYFSPGRLDRGRLEASGLAVFKQVNLWNGKANVRFAIPAAATAGDRLKVDVSVNDDSRVDPFESSFIIEVEPERPHNPPGGPPSPPGGQLAALPNIREVRRDDWARFTFNEYSAVEIRHSGDGDGLDLLVNMDNIFLRNELGKRRTQPQEQVAYWFKYGLCLQALGMLYRQRQRPAEEGSDGGDQAEGDGFDQIADASQGLAVTIVPVISQLSRGRE